VVERCTWSSIFKLQQLIAPQHPQIKQWYQINIDPLQTEKTTPSSSVQISFHASIVYWHIPGTGHIKHGSWITWNINKAHYGHIRRVQVPNLPVDQGLHNVPLWAV
jgi:hypothetical protein